MTFPRIFALILAGSAMSLSACSTVSESIPTVKIERKKPKIVKQVSYSEPAVQRAEAAMVCDNANMRARAADTNSKNDTARVLILEEGTRSNTILADVEVNCRDYFARQTTSAPIVSQASYPAPQPSYTREVAPIDGGYVPVPRPKAAPPKAAEAKTAGSYFYEIEKGDTLYQIARDNCTTVKAIARLNKISDPRSLDLGQILRVPTARCNKR